MLVSWNIVFSFLFFLLPSSENHQVTMVITLSSLFYDLMLFLTYLYEWILTYELMS